MRYRMNENLDSPVFEVFEIGRGIVCKTSSQELRGAGWYWQALSAKFVPQGKFHGPFQTAKQAHDDAAGAER